MPAEPNTTFHASQRAARLARLLDDRLGESAGARSARHLAPATPIAAAQPATPSPAGTPDAPTIERGWFHVGGRWHWFNALYSACGLYLRFSALPVVPDELHTDREHTCLECAVWVELADALTGRRPARD